MTQPDDVALDAQSQEARVDALLRHGWDGHPSVARRIAARYPEIARTNVFTAAVCGDVATVQRELARDASLARATGGPHSWTALAYVAYSRVDAEHALEIASMLLDAGADASFQFDDGWGNAFTLITGAIGLGEGVKPTHPQARELVELLIAHGADPYDTQALYNTSIVSDDIAWTALLWEHCARQGTTPLWSQVEGKALNAKHKVGTLNYLLGNAVANNHLARATWLLEHGADANTVHAYSGHSLHTMARVAGAQQLAALLASHGATAEALRGERALLAALMNGADDDVRAQVAESPALMQSAVPLLTAAMRGRADAARLLIELGAKADGADHDGITPLHRAAHAGAIDVIDVLLAAGATVDIRERKWGDTPLAWAVVLGRPQVAACLAPVSRDVRALAKLGRVERLREVLHAEPAQAKHARANHDMPTPLFCLPDDDAVATDVVRVLLENGAQTSAKNRDGRTAEQVARLCGLDQAATLLSHAS